MKHLRILSETIKKSSTSFFQENASENQTYTQKMHAAFAAVYPDFLAEAHLPNHILGMRYARETCQYPSPMKLLPISRKQAAITHKNCLVG